MTGMLDAALGHAEAKRRVFPCRERSKEPRVRHGCLDATTDPERIARWPLWESSNLAIATGDGLLVLDVDGELGAESLRELERRYHPLPTTPSVVTGSGGQHFYFACDEPVRNSAGTIAPGLDVRGQGGYVVAPPSVHPNGRAYVWDVDPAEVPLAVCPDWLLAVIRTPAATSDIAAIPTVTPITPVATAAETWLELLQNGIPEGKRNSELTRLTGHFLRRHIDPRVTLEVVQLVNASRCTPPLPEVEVERIVNSVAGSELRRRTAVAA